MKRSQVPLVTAELLKRQEYRCPLCQGSLRTTSVKNPALDHDHSTGYVRDVLCVNCNGIEGKTFNLVRRARGQLGTIQWLENLIAYYRRHETPQHGGIFHHTHETPEEKRLKRNAKAAARRKAIKGK